MIFFGFGCFNRSIFFFFLRSSLACAFAWRLMTTLRLRISSGSPSRKRKGDEKPEALLMADTRSMRPGERHTELVTPAKEIWPKVGWDGPP